MALLRVKRHILAAGGMADKLHRGTVLRLQLQLAAGRVRAGAVAVLGTMVVANGKAALERGVALGRPAVFHLAVLATDALLQHEAEYALVQHTLHQRKQPFVRLPIPAPAQAGERLHGLVFVLVHFLRADAVARAPVILHRAFKKIGVVRVPHAFRPGKLRQLTLYARERGRGQVARGLPFGTDVKVFLHLPGIDKVGPDVPHVQRFAPAAQLVQVGKVHLIDNLAAKVVAQRRDKGVNGPAVLRTLADTGTNQPAHQAEAAPAEFKVVLPGDGNNVPVARLGVGGNVREPG